MIPTAGKLADSLHTTLDLSLKSTQGVLDVTSHLTKLNLTTAHDIYRALLQMPQEACLADVKRPMQAFQPSHPTPTTLTLLAYWHGIHDAMGQSLEHLLSPLEAQLRTTNQTLIHQMNQVERQLPGGAALMVRTLKSALDAANASYNNLATVSHHVAELVESNLSTLSQAAARNMTTPYADRSSNS